MHFSTFSAGFALLTCRFDSLLWKIIPVLLDSGNKVEFFRLTQTSFFVRRKNSTLFPSSSKSGIIFHSALSNLQVRNAKRTEKVEKCISLELLFFLTERKYSLTLNCQESTIFRKVDVSWTISFSIDQINSTKIGLRQGQCRDFFSTLSRDPAKPRRTQLYELETNWSWVRTLRDELEIFYPEFVAFPTKKTNIFLFLLGKNPKLLLHTIAT